MPGLGSLHAPGLNNKPTMKPLEMLPGGMRQAEPRCPGAQRGTAGGTGNALLSELLEEELSCCWATNFPPKNGMGKATNQLAA